MQRLIMAIVLRENDKPAADRMIDDLMREYGRPEVTRMLGRLLENLSRPDDPEAEAAQLYAAYVTTWRRFGSDQPLLSAEEHQRLLNERAELLGKSMLKQQELTHEEQARLNVLSNQILAEPHLWDDLYPPAPPVIADCKQLMETDPSRLKPSMLLNSYDSGIAGGCSPMPSSRRRRFTTPARLSQSVSTVARPVGVRPIMISRSAPQAKWSVQRSRRGL